MEESPNSEISRIEIPIIDPEVTLPTEQMIQIGKTDFQAFIQKLSKEITPDYLKEQGKTLRSRILFDTHDRVGDLEGCFMGFTGYTSFFSDMLTMEDAAQFQEFVQQVSDSRIAAIVYPVSDMPDIARIKLINIAAAQRIMTSYPTIFSPESLENPVKYMRENSENTKYDNQIRMGLLSGFPSTAVELYCDSKTRQTYKSDRTVRGAGTFLYYGTDYENQYIQKAQELYQASNVETLIEDLRKEFR